MAFVDYKITWRKAEELHILNATDTLDTWSIVKIFFAFFSSLFK